jgi:hypothetical protein
MGNTKSVSESGSETKRSFSGVFTKKKQLKFWSTLANFSLVGLMFSFIFARIIACNHGYVFRRDFIQASINWILPAICFFLFYFISIVVFTCILINKAKTTITITPDGSLIHLSGLLSKTKTLDITGWKAYQVTQTTRYRKESFFVLEVATKNGSFMFADDIKNREFQNIVKIEGGDKTIQLLSENNKSAYEMAKFLGLIDK